MTDQTKCPHCGAEKSPEWKLLRFHCGTIVCDGEAFRSSQCELKTLRAKVAAQQELLKEAADALKDLEYVAAEVRKKLNAAT